tara:strand:- start:5690 stop:5908 length:219 start_codon:yes stop_codon:yes gene_type:complete
MVLGDMMGFSDSDYAYQQQRAHSADMFFVKMRFWFWGSCIALSSLLIGNIMGVFDINIMGWVVDKLWNSWGL